MTSNFRDGKFLKEHIMAIVRYYASRCIDTKNGGYINCFLDDGTICDYETKHLVGMSRFIYIFSVAAMISDSPAKYVEAAEHGLTFLEEHQHDKDHGGYYWILKGQDVYDSTKFAYGHAFVLLAVSTAYQAGIKKAGQLIEDVFDILETYFWRKEDGLYVDEISADWATVSPYRGQNANMHLCEAMMAAFEATGEARYLDRAYQLAHSVIFKLLPQSGSLIWEHYDENRKIDWEYNKDYTKSEFRPYGFIFGHSIEWSKLLQLLEKHKEEQWIFPQSERLFRTAADYGSDRRYGGIYYAMSPEGKIIDSDKLYWVMAEAIGASALFAAKTNKIAYRNFYEQIFKYCWRYFVDHKWGAWYQLLSVDNQKNSNIKSPPPKTDYHPITNCITAMKAFL
ncbi:mannose/cellobiose epimerase-like protein (N-acyl-D-glucosamine 2-epimerase family) [Bacillus capparidis]|nr:mannose/cellobiose epimerase-like protein (N-acyl-D-glucosamine 2-epimerase family) [Bacillus capparidis]